jgi:hypothetical protein
VNQCAEIETFILGRSDKRSSVETLKIRFGAITGHALLMWFAAALIMQPTAIGQFDFSAGGDILWEDHWHDNFDADEGERISISFHSNASVDVLIMDAVDYPDYVRAASQGQGTFDYYAQGSRFNNTFGSYSFVFPRTGTYAFIVDNTRVPAHGAESGVRVTFFIEGSTPPGPPDPLTYSTDISLLPLIVMVIVIVVVISVLLLVLLAGKRKEREVVPLIMPMQTGEPFVTQMVCSNCGNLVPIGTFCSKCGKRLQ